jgi:hypothetical protein
MDCHICGPFVYDYSGSFSPISRFRQSTKFCSGGTAAGTFGFYLSSLVASRFRFSPSFGDAPMSNGQQ